MRYTIWIVTPVNYMHSAAFNDVADSLCAAIIDLGHECGIVTSSFECRGRTIVLGAHLLEHIPVVDMPKDMIIWNMEQIFIGSPWLSEFYIGLLKGVYNQTHLSRHKFNIEIWDYSQVNIDVLAGMGVNAKLVPVGYMPILTRIPHGDEDIEVLHIGSITDRRMNIINHLSMRGVKIHFAFGCYGKERDELIARSKIVLNVHFYESKVFEIVRCSYMMANKKCVVSEKGLGDREYESGVFFSKYDGLVDSCIGLLGDEPRRLGVANNGFELFSRMNQTDYLKGVL